MKATDPSGMNAGVLERLKSGTERAPYRPLDRQRTPWGDVFVMETRQDDGEWHVIWAARGFAGDITFKFHSTPQQRAAEAINCATMFLSTNAQRIDALNG